MLFTLILHKPNTLYSQGIQLFHDVSHKPQLGIEWGRQAMFLLLWGSNGYNCRDSCWGMPPQPRLGNHYLLEETPTTKRWSKKHHQKSVIRRLRGWRWLSLRPNQRSTWRRPRKLSHCSQKSRRSFLGSFHPSELLLPWPGFFFNFSIPTHCSF